MREKPSFYNLKSYEAQLMYIVANVKEIEPKRRYVVRNRNPGKRKTRNFTRIYTLCNTVVCKEMFLKTIQVSCKKIGVCLEKHRQNSVNDMRGQLIGGWNKTPEEDTQFVVDLINKMLKYESHNRRLKNSDVLFLQPGMTLPKIYELYKLELKNA